METQESKNYQPNIGDTYSDYPEIAKAFKEKFNLEKSPCYFFSKEMWNDFVGIPNFQGISIYPAYENNEIVLIVIGTTKIKGELYDVRTYSFRINRDQALTVQNVLSPVFELGPCPPPTPCPPRYSVIALPKEGPLE
jgi:hypothetical protein